MIKNILSISGGKDSTAMLLRAKEMDVENLSAIFCDTGNEHQITYDYLDYLQGATGIEILHLKADFSQQLQKKRTYVLEKWPDKLAKERPELSTKDIQAICQRAAKALKPSGNPFLDLCLWKSRFPSTKRAFCSTELKRLPAEQHHLAEMEDGSTVISWQGIRRDESARRANYPEYGVEFGSWNDLTFGQWLEPGETRTPEGHLIYRPLVEWTASDAFAIHRRHNIKHNPLYEQGMGRVGCMPCINCRKSELAEINRRFPEEIQRIHEWERLVGDASKRGNSTFFPSTIDPVTREKNSAKVSRATHGIIKVVEWARTSRGGRQFDLLEPKGDDTFLCQSLYGLCE